MSMTSTLSPRVVRPVAEATVGMGQIAFLTSEGVGRAVLGSCVGLVLFEPRLRLAAIAHIVLPNSQGRAPATGKFVDTAVEAMVEGLQVLGAVPTRLIAKLAGGANMFDSKGPFQIGRQNVDAVYEQIAARRIRLTSEHIGGTRGRKTTFDCRTGEFLVEVLGDAPVVL